MYTTIFSDEEIENLLDIAYDKNCRGVLCEECAYRDELGENHCSQQLLGELWRMLENKKERGEVDRPTVLYELKTINEDDRSLDDFRCETSRGLFYSSREAQKEMERIFNGYVESGYEEISTYELRNIYTYKLSGNEAKKVGVNKTTLFPYVLSNVAYSYCCKILISENKQSAVAIKISERRIE